MQTLHQSVASDEEALIIHDILEFTEEYSLYEILKGAHVRIEDNGLLYEKWRSLENSRERISSHPAMKGSKQYGVMGSLFSEILFGVVEENGKICTFFQLEKTPWAPGFKNRVYHTVDAIQYLLWGKNIGPFGHSIHTDKTPLRLV